MLWEKFRDVLAEPQKEENKNTWLSIYSQDVIIGGIDYTIDTRYVHTSI